jgi:drug/metabolite transporter (DMT)-like permease
MALSFVIVPVASHFVFNEQVSVGSLTGALIVVIGLFVATRYS